MREPSGTRDDVRASGGAAALYLATAYVAGIAYFLVGVDFPSVVDPLDKIELFARHLRGLQVAYLGIYVVFGFVLIGLAWSLHRRLERAAPTTMRVATSVAIVWAGLLVAGGMVTNVGMETVVALHADDASQAVAVWLAIEAVTSGMTGGNGEILGGLWTLLVSWAAWRGRLLPVAMIVIGAIAGVAGLVSAFPGFDALVAAFGLTQLVWFVGLAVVLFRHQPVPPSTATK
ncbi:MAG: DUF4386 family protein [Trueperaceae bacterium]